MSPDDAMFAYSSCCYLFQIVIQNKIPSAPGLDNELSRYLTEANLLDACLICLTNLTKSALTKTKEFEVSVNIAFFESMNKIFDWFFRELFHISMIC